MTKDRKNFWLILISFFLIYIVWGSTYLANAWGIKEVPPFMFAGTRFILAGILLLIVARIFGPLTFTWKQVRNTMFAGFMLFAIGNGFLVWSLKYIDSGLSALLVAFEPLLVAILMWQVKNKRPGSQAWIGIGLGIIGISLLVGQPEFTESWDWIKGAIATLIAIFAWAYTSVWIPDAELPKSIFQSASMQMFFGGLFLVIISFSKGDFETFTFEQVSDNTWWAAAYLVLIGSMLTFSAFNYLLKEVGPVPVSACTFINPVVAMILGVWLNAENFSNQSILAAALMLTGVIFINGQVRVIKGFLRPTRPSK